MANQFNSALNMNSLPGGSFVKQFTGKVEEDNDEFAFSTSLSNGRPKREGKPRSGRILTERRNADKQQKIKTLQTIQWHKIV
jgi:hypothetical protein